MKNELKELRCLINQYFGEVKHSVRINKIHGRTLFDIEYYEPV